MGMALASALLCGTATQATSSTLCRADETVWFSCRVGTAKIVSLCGTRDTLQYRFGTAQHLELRHPAAPSTGHTAFRWAGYTRYQTNRTEVRFSRQGVDYILFDHMENMRRDTGVEVASATRLPCLGGLQSQLGKLKDKLPCDEDSALNLGACPTPSD